MPKGVETITRIRKPKVDRLRPATATEAAEATYGNCAVLPRQPIETDRGMVGVEGWDVFCFDPAADVVRTDQVSYKDEIYNVDGEPRRVSKKGRFKALQITLVKVS
jgi:hypothetical protein